MNWSTISKNAKKAMESVGKYSTEGGIFKLARTNMLGRNRKDWSRKLPRATRILTVMGAMGLATGQRVGQASAAAGGYVLGRSAGRPAVVTAVGITGAGLVGTARGIYRAAVDRTPHIEYGEPRGSYVGPGYNTWAKQRGMNANNLGATGSLSLALHKTRHR
jgi:hypothetical protein